MATVHPSVAKTIENSFEEMVNNLGSYVSSFSMKVLQILSGGISGIPGFVIKLVITVVATFFFVGDYDGITSFFKKLLSPKQLALVEKGQSYVKNVLFIYIRSYSFLFSSDICRAVRGNVSVGNALSCPSCIMYCCF